MPSSTGPTPGTKLAPSAALLGDHARQFPAQTHVDGQVRLHLDIVKGIEGVGVTIPVAERVAGADRAKLSRRLWPLQPWQMPAK